MTHSKPKHEIGTRKEVIRFAFIPMIVESRFVWLRWYISIHEYKLEFVWDDWNYEYYKEYYWKEVERKILRR